MSQNVTNLIGNINLDGARRLAYFNHHMMNWAKGIGLIFYKIVTIFDRIQLFDKYPASSGIFIKGLIYKF